MRMSDWSSDVCSSDLEHRAGRNIDIGVENEAEQQNAAGHRAYVGQADLSGAVIAEQPADRTLYDTDRVQDVQIGIGDDSGRQIGRPSGGGRGCAYVESPGGGD